MEEGPCFGRGDRRAVVGHVRFSKVESNQEDRTQYLVYSLAILDYRLVDFVRIK